MARKSECHNMYKNHIGDEWAPLISDIYVLCRNRGHYVIPLDVSDRQMLRSICERTLQFENYFLGLYREFLLDELSSGPPADGAHARWVLDQLPLADAAVRALRHCRSVDNIRSTGSTSLLPTSATQSQMAPKCRNRCHTPI
jgi:hypothetical protein